MTITGWWLFLRCIVLRTIRQQQSGCAFENGHTQSIVPHDGSFDEIVGRGPLGQHCWHGRHCGIDCQECNAELCSQDPAIRTTAEPRSSDCSRCCGAKVDMYVMGRPFAPPPPVQSPDVDSSAGGTHCAHHPVEMPALVDGLRLLDRFDPSAEVFLQESGEHVISVSGEVHLEVSNATLHVSGGQHSVTIEDCVSASLEMSEGPARSFCVHRNHCIAASG